MRKVLFWDFDGTLVVSNPMWPEAMLRIIQSETGRSDLTFHDIRPHTRIGFTWHTPDDDHTGYKGQLWWERMFVRFAEVLKLFGVPENRALPAARRMQEEILRVSNYEIYPDTKATLQYAIDHGWENYILSNNYPDMDLTMDALGLTPYFKDMVISARLGWDKPRAELFQYALDLAGITAACAENSGVGSAQTADPNAPAVRFVDAAGEEVQCFMVGDNPVADAFGASRAGLPCILVRKKTTVEDVVPAAYEFDSLTELQSIL